MPTTNYFNVRLDWTSEKEGFPWRIYLLAIKEKFFSVSITRITEDLGSAGSEAHKVMTKGHTYLCTLVVEAPFVWDEHEEETAFTLLSEEKFQPLATGIILNRLRRPENLNSQASGIGREDKEKLNGHRGKVIWLTGLLNSGKTTVANRLEAKLHAMSCHTCILDGDSLRGSLNSDLGFAEGDRVENVRRAAEVSKLMLDLGLIVIVSMIAPFRTERLMARKLIGKKDFIGVYVKTSLSTCEARDTSGLYLAAREGKITNLSGVNSPYEVPLQYDLVISGEREEELETSVDAIINALGGDFPRRIKIGLKSRAQSSGATARV